MRASPPIVCIGDMIENKRLKSGNDSFACPMKSSSSIKTASTTGVYIAFFRPDNALSDFILFTSRTSEMRRAKTRSAYRVDSISWLGLFSILLKWLSILPRISSVDVCFMTDESPVRSILFVLK